MTGVVLNEERRILFVSHEASRTGAVNLLLQIQVWLRRHTHLEFETLFLAGGELVSEFAALGRVHEASRPIARAARAHRRLQRLGARLLGREPGVTVGCAQIRGHFDLVHSNTGVSGQALGALRPLAGRVVSHIHEMPLALSRINPAALRSIVQHTDRFIAVSEAVAVGLQSALGVAAHNISTVNGFVPTELLGPRTDSRAQVRSALGLPADAWLLGVCGSGVLHKGFDLMPSLAVMLPAAVGGRPVHLLHIGRMHMPFYPQEVTHDLVLLGQAHRVHLLGPRVDVADLLSALDVHLLPSREDSFPLTVLESAAVGVPTVCFANAGGAPEFCADGAGLIVPYLDIAAMATACQRLLEHPAERSAMGNAAKARIRARHTPDVVMPQLLLAAGLA